MITYDYFLLHRRNVGSRLPTEYFSESHHVGMSMNISVTRLIADPRAVFSSAVVDK